MTKFISHRGESYDAPENTFSAFKLSIERKADGLETDIHLTKDNILVCMHNASTGDAANIDLVIKESTYQELSTLDCSHNKAGYKDERIPKFSELLELLTPNQEFFIEIKTTDEFALAEMARIMKEMNIPSKQIIMITFHKNIVIASKKYMPDVKVLWLTGFEKIDNKVTPSAEEAIEFIKSANADGIDAHARPEMFDEKYIAKFKENNLTTAIWTVNDAELANTYKSWGIDYITSDRASALSKEV